jgi:membrane protein implicated in regulation of membrane protease activity
LLRTVTAYMAAFVLQLLGTGIAVGGLFALLVGVGVLADEPGAGWVVTGLVFLVGGLLVAWKLSPVVTRALVGTDITYGQTGVMVTAPPSRRRRRRRDRGS